MNLFGDDLKPRVTPSPPKIGDDLLDEPTQFELFYLSEDRDNIPVNTEMGPNILSGNISGIKENLKAGNLPLFSQIDIFKDFLYEDSKTREVPMCLYSPEFIESIRITSPRQLFYAIDVCKGSLASLQDLKEDPIYSESFDSAAYQEILTKLDELNDFRLILNQILDVLMEERLI